MQRQQWYKLADECHFKNSMFQIIKSFRMELSVNRCLRTDGRAGSYKATTLCSCVFSLCLVVLPWCYCVCKCTRLVLFRTPMPATTSAAMTRSRFRATQMTGSTGKAHPASLCLCGHTLSSAHAPVHSPEASPALLYWFSMHIRHNGAAQTELLSGATWWNTRRLLLPAHLEALWQWRRAS